MARLSDVLPEISVGLVTHDRRVTEILHPSGAGPKKFWLPTATWSNSPTSGDVFAHAARRENFSGRMAAAGSRSGFARHKAHVLLADAFGTHPEIRLERFKHVVDFTQTKYPADSHVG